MGVVGSSAKTPSTFTNATRAILFTREVFVEVFIVCVRIDTKRM